MDPATMGRTQKEDGKGGIDQEDIFYRVVFFLAALTRRLFRSSLGADDAPFGAVMGKRGEGCPVAGAEAGMATDGESSASGAITVAPYASS
jgi:hypothetical protein